MDAPPVGVSKTQARTRSINAGACPMRVQLASLAPPTLVIARVLPFCRAVQETVLQRERAVGERIPLNRAGMQARGYLERA